MDKREIILISHGDLASGIKQSLEMIMGEQKCVHVVSLRPDGDDQQFASDLTTMVAACTAEEIVIIADLLGGTPCNVATKLYHDRKRISIFAGMNLALIMEVIMCKDTHAPSILKIARSAVVHIGTELCATKRAPVVSETDYNSYEEYSGQANLVNVRIDERLVHGQVAGIWSTSLDTQRIVVANDEAANDALQRNALRMATASTMRLSVLTVEQAAHNIEAGKYGKQRIFLLFKNPRDVERYLDAGGKLRQVNVGNMSYKEGTKEITKSIQVLPEEIPIFHQIAKQGVHVSAQLVPNDPVIDLMEKINERIKM